MINGLREDDVMAMVERKTLSAVTATSEDDGASLGQRRRMAI